MTDAIDKDHATRRARAARLGILVYRTAPEDGPVQFFAVRHGVPRHFPSAFEIDGYIARAEEQRRAEE